ncbi:MAG: peptidase C11 [Clostridia bacterium]|nr:peptidase C11 [Clostridia bacterium]
MNKRPIGREKNVTGQGKDFGRRGSGLGGGPVGKSDGYSGRNGGGGGSGGGGGGRSFGSGGNMTRGFGGSKLIIIIVAAVLLFGGGGSLIGNLLGGGSGGSGSGSGSILGGLVGGGGISDALSGLLGGFSGGDSVSSGWVQKANTGSLNESVASGARAKYTNIKGGGADTVTLMVYMCGADLETKGGMASNDIQEMLNANLGDKVNLLIYTGGAKQWKNNKVSSNYNQIHKVENHDLKTLVANDGTDAMTKPATLTRFIKYCVTNYKANRYQLILWDHGGGSISGYGYDEKNTSAGSMTLKGIDDALRSAGVKYDFIGFDTCLMATLENALMLNDYADYLIASEETEPGCGWYYSEWLTELSKNTSVPTTKLGEKIINDYSDFCAQKCAGQKTTLSLIDLAELSATVPDKLKSFASSTTALIQNNNFKQVSDARGGTREFASNNKIDQVDLVHLALNLNTSESKALANALLGAVKYNRTSSNMTNAYGLSVYFPYSKPGKVDSSIAACKAVDMDSEYLDCIKSYAALETGGQTASNGGSPLTSLFGGSGSSGGSGIDIGSLLGGLLGGKSVDPQRAANYISDHTFDETALAWVDSNGKKVIKMSSDNWSLVHDLELNVFYDDGEGYIDLGLDNVYEFTENGELIGEYDGTWLAIDDQPVAYYFVNGVEENGKYSITGRVPCLLNGQRANLILVFDSANPNGYIAGAQYDYIRGETETVAKELTGLEKGDRIDFVADFYGYDKQYKDSYMIGEQLVYTGNHKISNVYLPSKSKCTAMYMFRDFYGTEYWTAKIPG